MADFLKGSIQSLKARFSAASSSPAGNTLRGTPGRFLSWFRDIPVGAKFVFVGLVSIPVLIIIALLSPMIRFIAIVIFGMSILALIIRGVQRRSIREWGVIAIASLALIPIFGGVSSSVYESSEVFEETEPRTPQEEARAAIEPIFIDQIRSVRVQGASSSGYIIDVDFDAYCENNCSDDEFVNFIESDMRDSYEALFTSSLATNISQVTLTAKYTMVSSVDGAESDEVIFKTAIDGFTGRNVNWENASYIDFANVWEIEDIHVNYDPLLTSDPSFDTGSNDY